MTSQLEGGPHASSGSADFIEAAGKGGAARRRCSHTASTLALGTGRGQSGSAVKNPPAKQETQGTGGVDPWAGQIPWRRKYQPTPVLLA